MIKPIQIAKFKANCILSDYFYRKSSDYQKLINLQRLDGEVGFLIGNGPSVQVEDLEKIDGRISFCCNRFYLAYPTTSFRPTYTFCADRQVIEDFGKDIVSKSEGEVIFVNKTRPDIQNCIWVPNISRRRLVFKGSKLAHVTTGGGTLFTALQVGYFLGIRKFVLYGVDHNFNYVLNDSKDVYRSANGDNNHFIKGYRSGKKWCPPEMKLIEDSFRYADKFLRKKGGFLLNATRAGKLELLDRISLEEAIKL